MRIPEFQRPLRWQWEDVRRLFDSIVKGYPIGNLLLWQKHAPAARVKLGAISIDAPELPDAWWVVDGQQRLVSLANALSDEGANDQRYALGFDLRRSEFVVPPRVEDPFVIPLPVLFDLQRLFRWMITNQSASGKLDEASRITKAIREFSIPAYVVEQKEESILRDIFDRVNNSGKRLSRAEVFSALHPALAGAGTGQSSLEDVVATIERQCLFGQLNDDAVLSAILARRGPDVTRDIHAEFAEHAKVSRDFASETQDEAYRNGEAAIVLAVQFLQRDAGVPHVSFLPYGYLLAVLTRFFAHFPAPEARNRTLLRRWFWRAAMHGINVFRGGTTGATRQLAGRIHPGDETGSIERLLAAPMDRALPVPDLKRFNPKAAESRVVMCALWGLRPRSLLSGVEFGQGELSADLAAAGGLGPILDRILRREPPSHRAWAANRIFVLDEAMDGLVELLIGVSRVTSEGQSVAAVLESHALSERLLKELEEGHNEAFLDGRQQIMVRVVSDFIARMAEKDFEDTPPLDELDLDDDEPEDDRVQA
jgi:hypothetical protein